MATRKYDSTVARIAGDILSGQTLAMGDSSIAIRLRREAAHAAVALARDIVEEVKRTELTHADKAPAHVCGLTGYNGMIDLPCPGCEAWKKTSMPKGRRGRA